MIIRIALLLGLVVIGYLGFVRRHRLPVKIALLFSMLGVAALAVVFPEATNVVSH